MNTISSPMLGMSDSSSLDASDISDAEVDGENGIEMNRTASEISEDGSSMEMSYVSDAITDEENGREMNGKESHNGNTAQDTREDSSLGYQHIGEKDVIILGDGVDSVTDDKRNIMDTLNKDLNINERNERIPQVGMVFRSYEELINYFKLYALHVGFGVTIKKSAFTKLGLCRQLILVCSRWGIENIRTMYRARRAGTVPKTNCEAMISAKLRDDGLLHLIRVNLEHNHPVNPSTQRSIRCHKRMANPLACDNNAQLHKKEYMHSTEDGRMKLAQNNKVIHQFFACMQNKDPKFFYLVGLDQHGRLRNLFWADSRARAAYQCFGDVVTLDTTYITDYYDLPLVSFVGVNHHGQLVLLGCGLISDETSETYLWLFRAWLFCMIGCPPNAIITDQCKPIQSAVKEVFQGTIHRLCLSHILKKIPDKLGGIAEFKMIKKALKKIAYDSLRVDEFEESWRKMIETYDLGSHVWLKVLYDDRHSWAPAFLKDNMFWVGMSVSKRGESVPTFFDGYVFPTTSIKQFFSKYEMILESKFMKEVQADSEVFHKTPLIVSKFYMEEQLSNIYTLNMFIKFQDELKATMYCHVTPVKVDGSIFTFEIKECSYIEDGKRTESKDYEVLYNADELMVQCICGIFNFNGILCRHAISVLKMQQIFEIPSRYILDRWKKDFKQLALAHYSSDVLLNDLSGRYDYLSMRFLQLVESGFTSEDRYKISLKLIRNIEKSLLDDVSNGDRQRKLKIHSIQNNQKMLLSQLGMPEGNINPKSLPVKRRGRPLKKSREHNITPVARTNEEQGFLSSSLFASDNHVLQIPSTVSHLDEHIRQGCVDLMGHCEQQTVTNRGFSGFHSRCYRKLDTEGAFNPMNRVGDVNMQVSLFSIHRLTVQSYFEFVILSKN